MSQINMPDSEKKSSHKGSRKSRHKAQTELKQYSSLRFKTSNKKSQERKHNLKSKYHAQRVTAKLPRRIVKDSLDKGLRKNLSNRKLIRQNLDKTTDKKSSQTLSSLKLQGKHFSSSTEKEGNNADGEIKNKKLKRRRKKKSGRDNVELDEPSRLQRRTRYLIIKMKLEQNLIDAYSGEGWKGQSREKLRPEKELVRAQKQILKCKLGIRDAIRQLDSLSSVGSIEDSVIAPDGSVYHEHIFCAKCKMREAFPDNDIILCDGTCNRAFHQKCLDPPLETENIPPGDQGWFCKFCECKMEILDAVNAHLGTHFSMNSNWQDVFKEEAAFPDGDSALLNPEEEWPSDDSEDDDYNPEKREDSIGVEGNGNVSDDDSSSSTSLWSSDGEYPLDEGIDHEPVNSCMHSDESEELACGRRQRKAVDYKKLYHEMFGKDAPPFDQVSEDEDWGPGKRRRREKESDAINTLMTLHESESKLPNNDNNDLKEKDSLCIQIRRPCFRIPRDAVEKLRQAFSENELPSRSVKEGLSKELGLDAEKVNKWFKNARYLALKTRKQAEGEEQLQSFTSRNRLQNLEKDGPVTSTEASKTTIDNSQKNNIMLHTKQIRKRRPKVSLEKGKKDWVEFSDDMSLKKLLETRKRRANFKFHGDSQAAESEFERLSKLKDRIHNLKQRLVSVPNYRADGSVEPHLNETSVIYVPTAELREKA